MNRPTPDRRQVVKAGALAWTAPVVVYATGAPAFAASGADMSTSSGVVPGTPFTRAGTGATFSIVGNLVLRNTGTAATTSLTVTITVPSGVAATGHSSTPGGWTVTVLDATTVRFTSPTQLAAGASTTVQFTVRRSGGNGIDTVTAVVDPGGGGIQGTITGTTP